MASEFELIDLFQDIGSEFYSQNGIIIPPGDDCAVFQSNKPIITSVDSSVEGIHFPEDIEPSQIAYRSIAVALSDIAAMGCRPIAFSISISGLINDIDWYRNFSNGVKEISKIYEVPLIGGDFTKGQLNINIIVYGEPFLDKILKRSGANDGDFICISKQVGRAKKGLKDLQLGKTNSSFIDDYLRPEPKIDLGKEISEIATSCIDTSDGLLADLKHILNSSNVGAEIYLDEVPFTQNIDDINAGDDYDLCFTIPEKYLKDSFYIIGKVTKNKSIKLISEKGYDVEINGYKHF